MPLLPPLCFRKKHLGNSARVGAFPSSGSPGWSVAGRSIRYDCGSVPIETVAGSFQKEVCEAERRRKQRES